MTDLATSLQPQIDWLARLVGYPTISARSNLDLIDDVEAYLEGFGISSHRVYNEDKTKANLYAIIGPQAEDGIVLSGHTDVVPVEGQAWDSDPFTLTRRGDLLYGRGTCDMKAFTAIILSLLPEIDIPQLKTPLILALSYDEEIGCLGAPDMIREIAAHIPRPAAVIVGEPTSMKVINGHKGICSLRTTVTGYTTHSSQSDRGVSAVMMAARLIVKMEAIAAGLAARARADSAFSPPYSTLTVNVIEGGTQLNIMAGECWFDWDLRCVPWDKPADIINEVTRAAAALEAEMQQKHADCRIRVDWRTNAPPLEPEADNPAEALAQSITGYNHTEVVAYAAEAGQFQEAGFKTIICGPGSIDQAHQPNEFISLEQMKAGTDFVRTLITRVSA